MGTFLVLAFTGAVHAYTMIDGVPVPDDVMEVARQAVLSNTPQEALLRGDNPFVDHPFFQQLLARVDFKVVNEEAAKAMVQVFTRDEMEALLRFQMSPEGRSISIKMKSYQQLVGAILQNQLKTAMEAYIATSGLKGKVDLDGQPIGQQTGQQPDMPIGMGGGGGLLPGIGGGLGGGLGGGMGGMMGIPTLPQGIGGSPLGQ